LGVVSKVTFREPAASWTFFVSTSAPSAKSRTAAGWATVVFP